MRRIIVLLGFIAVLAIVFVGGGGLGYYAHKLQMQPIFGLAERSEAKGRRTLGMPSETVGMVEQIDTIYLRMRGSVYEMPNNDFRNGGALTVWDDDVMAMHKSGRLYYLDDENGALVQADFEVPDNGRAAYVALAAEKYPGRNTREGSIRYNDIEFIESAELRGFALSYTFINADAECYASRVAWLPVAEDVQTIRELSAAADDWEIVHETQPCLAFNATRELIVPYMAGGRIAFKEPNLLYMGSGEYHLDGLYRPDAGIQSLDSDYGKTLEINLEARTSRVFSMGHRNLQGVTLDRDGRLWTTEHGMRGGDELNLIVDGENYGWPLENLGTLYSGIPAPSESGVGRHETFRAPVYAWLPSAAVSSLALVDNFHEAWDGDLLIGSLKGRTLFRARVQGDRLIFLEEIPIGQRIRDVMQVADNKIGLWLDTNELVILTLEEREDPLAGLVDALIAEDMSRDLAIETAATMEACSECHAYEENVHGAGPSLYGLFERPIAGSTYANYSDALKSASGTWDQDRLTAYLQEPETVFDGTYMSGMGVGDPDRADALTKAFIWLKARQDGPQRYQ